MNVDLRRFAYALEPLRKQREWELERLRARLGAVQREIDAATKRIAELRGWLDRESHPEEAPTSGGLDPNRRRSRVEWLAQLRRRIAEGEDALARLRDARAEAARACTEGQRRLDVVERDRADALAEYVREEELRTAAEADRDWLSRRRWTREVEVSDLAQGAGR